MRTNPEYNLPFTPKSKPVLANKATNKSLNLLHIFLILVITLSSAPNLAPIMSQDNKTSPKYQETGHLILHRDKPCNVSLLICTFLTFQFAFFFQFTSSTTASVTPNTCKTGRRRNYCLHSFCKQHKKTSLSLQRLIFIFCFFNIYC